MNLYKNVLARVPPPQCTDRPIRLPLRQFFVTFSNIKKQVPIRQSIIMHVFPTIIASNWTLFFFYPEREPSRCEKFDRR